MCRLLLIKSEQEFEINPYLETFSSICKNSKEYQGHGWGMTYMDGRRRDIYKSLKPIWADDFSIFGSARFLLVHARSAFRDEGIKLENNMPFMDEKYSFIFNGELHGVRIKEEGRIGAERIFNYIKRFYKDDMQEAFQKAVRIINKKTKYIRAMNILMSDFHSIYLCSIFNEDEEYFSLFKKQTVDALIICSGPFPKEQGWKPVPNNTIEVLQ